MILFYSVGLSQIIDLPNGIGFGAWPRELRLLFSTDAGAQHRHSSGEWGAFRKRFYLRKLPSASCVEVYCWGPVSFLSLESRLVTFLIFFRVYTHSLKKQLSFLKVWCRRGRIQHVVSFLVRWRYSYYIHGNIGHTKYM